MGEKGFTLIELMVVLVIVAILVGIAYPTYLEQVRKTRRSEGKAFLMEVMSAEERYYTENNKYTTDLTDLGYGAASDVASEGGWYKVSAAACTGSTITSCVKLTAKPQKAQSSDPCGNLTLDSRGNKGAAKSGCW